MDLKRDLQSQLRKRCVRILQGGFVFSLEGNLLPGEHQDGPHWSVGGIATTLKKVFDWIPERKGS
jgi:hypothetical protein